MLTQTETRCKRHAAGGARRSWVKRHDFWPAAAFKLRGLLMLPPLLVLFCSTRWEWEHDLAVWSLGSGFFLAGLLLRVWAQRHLKYRLRGTSSLATSGPYACVRNPVYVANMLILAGLCVLCELLWMLPLILIWAALVYSLAIRFEESRLAKRFGDDYAAYRQRVPRWLPRVPRVLATPLARPVRWSRAVLAEWHCVLLLLIPALKEYVM